MQIMNWTMARLGSRFSLTFEPYHRRVLHSALGRFLDQPLDLMVGLEEPDGTRRVLPFTQQGKPLYCPEMFERLNSVTFRGHSEAYCLRYEFNVHSVFYPQDERMCLSPAFYLEMRVNPAKMVRWIKPKGPTPTTVKLFIRLARPDTQITASEQDNGRIDLSYRNTLAARLENVDRLPWIADDGRTVQIHERIVSLNPGAVPDADGQGLTLELPVSEIGSGIKWRLVWAAFCGEPVLQVRSQNQVHDVPLHYVSHFKSLDDVVRDAVDNRDDRLLLSRNFEKVFEQTPLRGAQRHLLTQGFQAFLANTFWGDLPGRPWFSVWEGSCFFHSTVDVEYNNALWYLALWPQLLQWQLHQWAEHFSEHAPSGGVFLHHDMGGGVRAVGQAYNHPMPVEENCNYLLLLQAYAHWTGDLEPARQHADFVAKLAQYLLWTDRDSSGFPSEGTANTIDDAGPAAQYARKQTYLAVKRVSALRAAADILGRVGQDELSQRCDRAVDQAVPRIESQAWLGDHYAVCVDRSAQGLRDVWTNQPLPYDQLPGWDGYSIYTGNGLLLPMMIAQTPLMDAQRLVLDMRAALRETLGPYGCGHTSADSDNVWVSQNLWRDHLARYLGLVWPDLSTQYWDMEVASNTADQSCGFIDTYVYNNLSFYPRGATAIGYLIAGPRLVIDRLGAGGARISVEPDRYAPQRWPLLALADWKAGKIPICVINPDGKVTIENEMDPVMVRDGTSSGDTIG